LENANDTDNIIIIIFNNNVFWRTDLVVAFLFWIHIEYLLFCFWKIFLLCIISCYYFFYYFIILLFLKRFASFITTTILYLIIVRFSFFGCFALIKCTIDIFPSLRFISFMLLINRYGGIAAKIYLLFEYKY